MERLIERLLVGCRYLMVPLYVGLAVLLLGLIFAFFSHLFHLLVALPGMEETRLIFSALSAVDLVLVASLILMVMLSGYANFVSTLDLAEEHSHLAWIGKLDQGSLKVKIAVSIVTIALIRLLGAFMEIQDWDSTHLLWLVVIHVTLILSALALAWMDKITGDKH